MFDVPAAPESVRPTRGDVGAGSSLGPYELLTPVAQGGMAVVWAARIRGHKGFQKLVALKTMHRALSLDPRFESMFLAEAEFASRIDHPNVCTIRDLGEERGCLYLAMDWIDGDTLASVEGQHPSGLPIPFAALIVRDVALGLHSAHELESSRGEALGLVHCDVSPQNILLSPDGVVKVVDFGLARATNAFRAPGFDRHVGGKMSFMSPEQGEGEPLDRRSDVFSLGIVLYRLLTGKHPFEGETSLIRFKRMRDNLEPLTPPAELRKDCPRALSNVVVRALEKHPAFRFQSMKELAGALEAALPEIRKPSLRDELAVFAEKAVRNAVKKRRDAIDVALEIANRRRAENASPDPSQIEAEPESLPSSDLQDLDDEARPAMLTNRPVAFSLPPAAKSRPLMFGSAAVLVLVASTSLWMWRSSQTAPAATPVTTAVAAAAPRAIQPELTAPEPEQPSEPAAPAPSAKMTSPTKQQGATVFAQTAPLAASADADGAAPAPAASAEDSWRYDPGF